MNRLIDNLFSYEIILLLLGVFLFMLLCAGLVYLIIKKQDVKKLLWFFPFPIIMIGYPSIQEIRIENDKLSIKKYTDEVIENPEDSIARSELSKVTEKLEKRAINIEDIKVVAEANLVLGNPKKVIQLTEKIIEEETSTKATVDSLINDEFKESRNKVSVLKELQQVARAQRMLETNPEIAKDTAKLKEQLTKIEWKNPKTENYLKTKIAKQPKVENEK